MEMLYNVKKAIVKEVRNINGMKNSRPHGISSEKEFTNRLVASQLIKNYIKNDSENSVNLDFCKDMLPDGIPEKFRLVVLQSDCIGDSVDLDALKKALFSIAFMAEREREDYIIIAADLDIPAKVEALYEKMKAFFDGERFVMLAGDYCGIADVPVEYKKITDAEQICFYYDEGLYYVSRISFNDTEYAEYDFYKSDYALSSTDGHKIRDCVREFAKYLTDNMLIKRKAQVLCKRFINGCVIKKNKYIDYFYGNAIQKLSDFLEFMELYIKDVEYEASSGKMKAYSSTIKETIRIIENNISNENLSLRWLAGNILYTNVDYLGKLFKKETGKNFSHYVMELRMEMAKRLILEGQKDKIYEVAEKVGYGSNSQYFSQVFKKYTGISPLEYKEFVRKKNNNR